MEPLSIYATASAVNERRLSAVDIARAHLARVERCNGHLNAFVHLDPEQTLADAAEVDRRVGEGQRDMPLAGVPISIKDLIAVRGFELNAGSRILRGYRPPVDATVVARLRSAGAVILGKVSLDEFAMGSTNESSITGAVRNPWDLSRVPGGSSGGSGAAVSAQLGLASLGTDTGGSVRLPAAFCGAVGVKPTYGRVSRSGVVAYASSLDQVGPICRDVRDAAAILNVIAGVCDQDSTSVARSPHNWSEDCVDDVSGLKFGVVSDWLERLSPEVSQAVSEAADALIAAGATRVDITLSHDQLAVPAYYVIAMSEASTNLARYDGVRFGHRAELATGDDLDALYARSRAEGFGAEVRRRVILGTWALSSGYYDAYYDRACRVRRLVRDELVGVLADVDVLLGPTAPRTAWELGDPSMDPLTTYQMDIYTTAANLAGLPAMSLPWGLGADGLPLAVQLHANAWDEASLFRWGTALEAQSPALPPTPTAIAAIEEAARD